MKLYSGKFGGVVASIPQPIVAAILCITFGVVGKCIAYLMHNNTLGLHVATAWG